MQNVYNVVAVINFIITILATLPLIIKRWQDLRKKERRDEAIHDDKMIDVADGRTESKEDVTSSCSEKSLDTHRENNSGTGRDFTQYLLDGEGPFGKGRLVLAVIKKYVQKNPSVGYSDLMVVFPKSLRGINDRGKTFWGCVNLKKDAVELFNETGRSRHFLNDQDVIRLSDGNEVVVSSQWGASNIDIFIGKAKSLGFKITKMS